MQVELAQFTLVRLLVDPGHPQPLRLADSLVNRAQLIEVGMPRAGLALLAIAAVAAHQDYRPRPGGHQRLFETAWMQFQQ